jgi:uncharacterized protein YjdB
MASPVVAGVAALLFSQNNSFSVDKVKEILYASAKDLGAAGKDDYFGYGRVDAKAALGFLYSNKVGKIVFKETTKPLILGKTYTIAATVLPANANNKLLDWSSSAPKIVRVDANGKIKALKNGKAVIKAVAKDGSGQVATCKITVGAKVKSVSLSKKSFTLKKNKSVKLRAKVKPLTAADKTVTWKSSRQKVATVDANGKVTAGSKGKATITVRTNDGKKVAKIKITVK